MREILMCCDEGFEVAAEPGEQLVDSRGIAVLMAARCVERLPADQVLSPDQSFGLWYQF